MRWLVVVVAVLAAVAATACNKSSPTQPARGSAANVVLTGTTHSSGSDGLCMTSYNLKNVGENTAYHVYVQDNTGAHTCYQGQIEPGGTSFSNSDRATPCPVFGSIHWSETP